MVRQPGGGARRPPTPGPRRRSSLGLHVDLGEWVRRDGAWTAVYEVVPDRRRPAGGRGRGARAACAAFGALTGRDPTHLDSHQHVHNWESVTEVFRRLATQLGVPLRHHLGGVSYCGDLYGHDEHGQPIPEAITAGDADRDHRRPGAGRHRAGLPPRASAPTPGRPTTTSASRRWRSCATPRVAEALRREGIALRSFADVASDGTGAR